ncbi:NADH-quinone oxidoreductase subunit NuoE [Salinarimonas rosea]|uniref:NADH-quinone oxidoreductase subunit NuoE n=1 Tax=Salinarimonas rosea TaxID=552063 RepID=UPI000490BF8F|nr:NADH-quinone oxidoreductase subunit NuoE [Salinarimonas rosea]
MAVRRLAPDAVQPKSFAFTPQTEAWLVEQVRKYPVGRQASAVIPLLWRVQKDCGNWLPQKAIEAVAERLAMPYIRVFEVATFYTMFNLEPVGKFYIQMCGTTPCQLRGSDAVKKVLERRIGAPQHVTDDGLFSWLEVECLGACCNAPMVQINDDYYEDLTEENFDKLLDDLAAGREVRTGSQQGRTSSEPTDNVQTLQDPGLYDGSRVGAWKKRFEEEAIRKAAEEKAKEDEAKAEAASAAKEAAVEPKPGKPDSGRATESPVADAPAQRAAAGERPVDPGARVTASEEGSRKTVDAQAVAEEEEVASRLATLPKDASAEDKANAVGERPAGLDAPRGGTADDLKKILGIGPANEKKLNGLGIWHFDQIAAWERPQIRWVGTYLAFPGRIDRENWVEQARALADGNTPS